MKRIYISHPFAGDIIANLGKVTGICRKLVDEGYLPIAPHLLFPLFVDEDAERELSLRLCMELVKACDELWLFGERISANMLCELETAQTLGMPVENRMKREIQA